MEARHSVKQAWFERLVGTNVEGLRQVLQRLTSLPKNP